MVYDPLAPNLVLRVLEFKVHELGEATVVLLEQDLDGVVPVVADRKPVVPRSKTPGHGHRLDHGLDVDRNVGPVGTNGHGKTELRKIVNSHHMVPLSVFVFS